MIDCKTFWELVSRIKDILPSEFLALRKHHDNCQECKAKIDVGSELARNALPKERVELMTLLAEIKAREMHDATSHDPELNPKRTIKGEWEGFWKAVRPDDAEPEQEHGMRLAFYAGAYAYSAIVCDVMADSVSREEAGDIMQAAHDEVRKFLKEVAAEAE